MFFNQHISHLKDFDSGMNDDSICSLKYIVFISETTLIHVGNAEESSAAIVTMVLS